MSVFIMLLLLCLQGLVQAKQRIGETRVVSIDTPHPYENGSGPDTLVWSHTLTHTGAGHIKIHFKNFSVAGSAEGGDYVLLKDKDGNVAQRLSGLNIGDHWALSVMGDTVIIELYADAEENAYGFGVDMYAFAYGTSEGSPALERPAEEKSVLLKANPHGLIGKSLQTEPEELNGMRVRPQRICGNSDLASICTTDKKRIKLSQAVGKIEYVDDCGFLAACTGFLFKKDGSFMTAAHCVNSPSECNSAEVWLNYTADDPSEACGRKNRPNPDIFLCKEIQRTSCGLDYTVISLKGNPAKIYGWLRLSKNEPQAGDPIWVPQHPEGGVRKISEIDEVVVSAMVGGFNCCDDPPCSPPCCNDTPPCDDPKCFCTPTGIKSEFTHSADTAPGSSGSPVISATTNKVIGLHHASGSCDDPEGPNFAVLSATIATELAKGHCVDGATFEVIETWNDGTFTEDNFDFSGFDFFESEGERVLTSELLSSAICNETACPEEGCFVAPPSLPFKTKVVRNRFVSVYRCPEDHCKAVITGKIFSGTGAACFWIKGKISINKRCAPLSLEGLRNARFIGRRVTVE